MTYEDLSKQQFGFLEQTADLTDPITGSGVDYYKIGYEDKSLGDFLNLENEVTVNYYGNTTVPQHARVVGGSLEGARVASRMTHGILWALHYGNIDLSADSEPDKEKVLTPRAGGTDMNDVAFRWQTENLFRTSVNTKIKTINMSWVIGNPLVSAMSLFSEKVINAAYQADHTPIYPENQNAFYRKDSNFAFEWDVDLAADSNGNNVYSGIGSGYDYTADVLSFTFQSINTNKSFRDSDTKYSRFFEGNFASSINFELIRKTDNTKIHDDHDSQRTTNPETFEDMHIKMYQDSTHYFQLDLEDVVLTKVIPNKVHDKQSGDTFQKYTCEGIPLSPVLTFKDGVNSGKYPS